MLIDVSYFTLGPRHIQNATISATQSQNSLSVNAAILGYIRHYQLAFLCEMLGDDLAVAVDGYLNEKEQAENDNAEFETNTQYEFLCAKLKESFADYVFFHILRDSNTEATTTGLVVIKSENEKVAPIYRQVSIWNEMVERNIRFKAWAAVNMPSASVSSNMTRNINQFNL